MAEAVTRRTAVSGPNRFPPGGAEFLSLLLRLLSRRRRGDRRLPIFWLVQPAGSADLLDQLRRALGRGRTRRVPHAVVDAASPGADVTALLREAYRQLSLEAFGAERLRFRHFPLADWLIRQTLGADLDADEHRTALARRLRDRRSGAPAGEPGLPTTIGVSGAQDTIATAYQFALWLVRRAIPSAVFRVAISGRVPLVGRHYRWFMRQQYLAPRQSVTFLGFAERLTAGWRDGEQPDQVDKLLVHAFLEDLRLSYQRRVWRPSTWRRTAYPMLLLSGAGPTSGGHDSADQDNAGPASGGRDGAGPNPAGRDNAGSVRARQDGAGSGDAANTLVRLLNDVRNETGRNDPLLVVTAGPAAPPGQPTPYPLLEAEEAYEEWADVLPEARRLRRPAAWLVALAVGEPDPNPRGALPAFTAPKPPWWSRRFVPAAACLLLLAPAVVLAGTRWSPDCRPQPLRGHVSVRLAGGECIGYSDNAAHVFNHDPGQDKLRAVERRIFEQNATAERVWLDSDRRRPYLTLVYLGTLTGNRTRADEESYVSEREELEGMATAQYALLREPAASAGAALLRVVVANGGHEMRYATRTVSMIARLAREDPTIVGVVGLVESRTSTASAIRDLNRAGLPALAPTLSADGIYQNSRLYLQMSAPNADQASMVERYASKVLRVRDAHVYYTTGDGGPAESDLYVDTLVRDLRQRFGSRLGAVRQWSTGQRLSTECGYPGLLFFAGRWSQFADFLRELKECGANPPRHLVADDSVNRYMANPGLRASAPGNLPLTYTSKAALGTCSALRTARDQRDDVRGSFLAWVSAPNLLGPPRCRDGARVPVGERVSLAYDATTMMVRAVESLAARLRHASPAERWAPTAITPVTVHAEVLRQNTEQGFPGVSGMIRFGADSGEPVDKRISLMRVDRITDLDSEPVEVFHCGADEPTVPTAPGTPSCAPA